MRHDKGTRRQGDTETRREAPPSFYLRVSVSPCLLVFGEAMLLLQTQPVAGRVEHLAFAPDGRFLLAAVEQSPTVFVWELPSGEPRAPVAARSAVTALACGQGG